MDVSGRLFHQYLPDLDLYLAALLFDLTNTCQLPPDVHDLVAKSFVVEKHGGHGIYEHVSRTIFGILHSVCHEPALLFEGAYEYYRHGKMYARVEHPKLTLITCR